eukprot:scaffold3824_cov108-Isochrysis_galbana.AAC.3
MGTVGTITQHSAPAWHPAVAALCMLALDLRRHSFSQLASFHHLSYATASFFGHRTVFQVFSNQ